ncbi:hypothetical protein MLD38_025205 [Melastoma candidum]|uniref:Uncharacterized protein n=1 Tax=Melastoma candidum TaxID=119954 RepID=A0ACB9NUM6_9MYRT|nr:hypothetical protein MLD38_025205 [Melastoma candidum]
MRSSLHRYFTEYARIHVTALDGIVNVNSLFTVALFLGLASVSDPKTIDLKLIHDDDSGPRSCSATVAMARNLVAFHVYSFSSFMFSSLVALSLKQAIRVTDTTDDDDETTVRGHSSGATLGHINARVLRVGILMSALGSASGSGFLMMAIVNLVQIKLGMLWCGSSGGHTLAAIVPLVVLVPSSLLVYLGLAVYAFRQ